MEENIYRRVKGWDTDVYLAVATSLLSDVDWKPDINFILF